MATKLKNLTVRQIGLVDRGANQEATIALAKRVTKDAAEGPPCPTCGGDHTLANHDAAMSKAAQEQQMAEDLQKQLDAAKAEAEAAKTELATLKGTGTLTTDAETLRKQYEATQLELEKGRKALQDELEIAKTEKDAALAEVTKIRKDRRRERFIKRVQELKHLPGAPADDFAEILEKIETVLTPAQFAKINTLFDSWDTLLEKNAVFSEMGATGGGEAMMVGAAARLDILAKELMTKDTALTYAKAYDKAMKENPALYRKYRAEQTGGQ